MYINWVCNHNLHLSDYWQLLPFSYSELSAPRSHLIDNNKMILSDVTFVNKKLYLVDKNLVTVNRIDQQDKKASRTELVVSLFIY